MGIIFSYFFNCTVTGIYKFYMVSNYILYTLWFHLLFNHKDAFH